MIYSAQYEVADQDLTLAELTPEAIQRFTEDYLRLGFVLAGPIEPPTLICLEGEPWIEVQARVRSASNLLAAITHTPAGRPTK